MRHRERVSELDSPFPRNVQRGCLCGAQVELVQARRAATRVVHSIHALSRTNIVTPSTATGRCCRSGVEPNSASTPSTEIVTGTSNKATHPSDLLQRPNAHTVPKT